MCILSKLSFLGMPAAMQSKRKGKQALKWALKPSLQCSENKSLFAAKKINWQQYRVSLFTVSPAYTRTFTPLCSSTNWHQLRRGSTRCLELSHGGPGRAPGSSLFSELGSIACLPARRRVHHGDGSTSCTPLLARGARLGADRPSGTTGTRLRVPLPTGEFGSQHCRGLAWQLWPGISHHWAFAFLCSLTL